jgi:hypothetical protein
MLFSSTLTLPVSQHFFAFIHARSLLATAPLNDSLLRDPPRNKTPQPWYQASRQILKQHCPHGTSTLAGSMRVAWVWLWARRMRMIADKSEKHPRPRFTMISSTSSPPRPPHHGQRTTNTGARPTLGVNTGIRHEAADTARVRYDPRTVCKKSGERV